MVRARPFENRYDLLNGNLLESLVAGGDGRCLYQRSHGMSGREMQAGVDVLSAFALMIGGALGVSLPMTLVIIWICS